jgi:hypothetical protein
MSRARIVYHGKFFRSSVLCLGLGFLIAGCPLIVYFTQPGAPVANLVVAVIAGPAFFAVSFYFLLRYKALVLLPEERTVLMIEGVFTSRRVRACPFDQVTEVRLIRDVLDHDDVGAVWRLEVALRNGPPMGLDQVDWDAGVDRVRAVASTIGVKGVAQDRVVYQPLKG